MGERVNKQRVFHLHLVKNLFIHDELLIYEHIHLVIRSDSVGDNLLADPCATSWEKVKWDNENFLVGQEVEVEIQPVHHIRPFLDTL